MSEEKPAPKGSGEGGWLMSWAFRRWAGPPEVQGAIQGGSNEAREAWKQDLERRKQWSREQRERKRAEREARRGGH
ncbi:MULTISPECIES: hypothetical protein [unclassified Micromonospora]|uniref:hypothetical protein n=1 Tax=unclassified Micromonospora TaxID=2617518 RepID=UPI00332EE58C